MLSMVLLSGIGTHPDLIVNEWQVVSVVRSTLGRVQYIVIPSCDGPLNSAQLLLKGLIS